MLASELRELTIEQLQSLCHCIVVEMLRRVEEAEESKAEVHNAADQLAEVSDIWQTEVKVLKEVCEKAADSLRIISGALEFKQFNIAPIRTVCDELLDGLERAKALEQ